LALPPPIQRPLGPGACASITGKTLNSWFIQPTVAGTTLTGDNTALVIASGALGTSTTVANSNVVISNLSSITLGNGEGVIYVGLGTETSP